MIPDHAVVMDRDGDLWTFWADLWVCRTAQSQPLDEAELLAEFGPLDVLVWRHRIELKDEE